MPPKKGLSQEEKLQSLLTWFQASHSFYTIKEVEQKASKACKISSMQIKELVTSLVNESLIEQEKCGTTNLFWSFQYTAHKKKLQMQDQLKQTIIKLQAEKNNLAVDLQNSVFERDNLNYSRDDQIRRCNQLAQEMAVLEEQLKLTKQKETIENLVQSIEFFNELIELVLSYLSHRSGASVSVLKNEFGIPLELEDTPQIDNSGANV